MHSMPLLILQIPSRSGATEARVPAGRVGGAG